MICRRRADRRCPARFGSPAVWFIALAVLPLAGCSFVTRRGPPIEAQVECRQLSQRGMRELDRGNYLEAERLFAEGLAACPVDPDARRHYADALWQRGAHDDALEQIEEALRLSPDNAAFRTRAAEMYLELGEADAALAAVQRALDIDPGRADAWRVRGRIVEESGDLRRALADYQRALATRPDDPDLLVRIAEVYRRMDRPQQALANLQAAADVQSPSESPEVQYLTGLALLALARYGDAIDQLAAAAATNPTPEGLYRLAEAHWLSGHVAEARGAAEQALALAPRHPGASALLERLASAQSLPGGAIQR